MTYATRQNFIDRFSAVELMQLTDRDNNGIEDPGVLDQALGDADAEINTYLAKRYALPLAVVPQVISRIACDITRYRLYGQQSPQEVRTRYTDAVKVLQSLADGSVTLGLDPAPTGGGADPLPQAAGADRVFTRDTLKDF